MVGVVTPCRWGAKPSRSVEDGAALTIARRRKERTCPELTGSGRPKLVEQVSWRLPQTPSQDSVHSEGVARSR